MLFLIAVTSTVTFQAQNPTPLIDSTGQVVMYIHENGKNKKLVQLLDSLHNLGYLGAEILRKDSAFIVKKGKKYHWAKIELEDKHKDILKKTGFNSLQWEGKYISPAKISALSEKILDFLDNTGYPFAYVYLDDIDFTGQDSVKTKLKIIKNKRFYFDSLEITSDIELSTSFLKNYLDIQRDDIYDYSKVKTIKKKLNNLKFVELASEPAVAFYGNQATIKLNLKYKKINRFDLLLGLQPGETGVRKFKLTGNIRAEMINKLGRAEKLYFEYKNLTGSRQDLVLKFNYPYVFNLPFGLDTKFGIFIDNERYRDVKLNAGVQYLFSGLNNIKIYWQNFSSRLLNLDTAALITRGRLPDRLDLTVNSMGLQLYYNALDYRYNPRTGWMITASGQAGMRKIHKNPQISDLGKIHGIDFDYMYDTLQLKSYILDFKTDISYFIPLSSNTVIKLSNNTAWKHSQRQLYHNELFRLGGNKILRGFDEESIYAGFYTLSTVELRLIIEKNSFLFVFGDFAYLHNPYLENKKYDLPYGIGAGINFDTKNGILSISTAAGSQQNNPLDLKNVKIHIGYTSMF